MKFWSRIKAWFTGAPNQLSIPSDELLPVASPSPVAQKPAPPLRALPSIKQQKPLKTVANKPFVVTQKATPKDATNVEPAPITPAIADSPPSKPVALVATVTKRAELAMSTKSRPPQLNLFRLVQEGFTNAFDFYEAIPRFVVARWKHQHYLRNPDGSTAPLKRHFAFGGRHYRLSITPAYIDKTDGTSKAQFLGVREEIIEFVLYKISHEAGFFTSEGDETKSKDTFALTTTLYRIHEELKARGNERSKCDAYSYAQIREALLVLAKTRFHLKSEDGDDDLVFSPISEFIYLDHKDGSKPAWANAKIHIRFNSLTSKSILARKWRQIDFHSIIEEPHYLARWLRKTLSLRYTHADTKNSFNIRLSTLIDSSGISLYAKMSDNLRYVERSVRAMTDCIEHLTVEKDFAVSPETGKGRVLVDAMLIITPTKDFITEQIKSNVHHIRLDEAVETLDGEVITEPKRHQFQSVQAYEDARHRYMTGRRIAGSTEKTPNC